MLWRLLVFFLSPVCGPSRVFFNFFFLFFLFLGKKLDFFSSFSPLVSLSLFHADTNTRRRQKIYYTRARIKREELREHLSPESKSERERG